jgi:ribonuclease P protein component
VKRWIREWFRKTQTKLPPGLDLVVVVRRGAAEAGHAAVTRDLDLLARALARGP